MGEQPDARTWTFHLRHGVTFHKGYGEMTADDVAFTFDRLLDPKALISSRAIYENIVGTKATDPRPSYSRSSAPIRCSAAARSTRWAEISSATVR